MSAGICVLQKPAESAVIGYTRDTECASGSARGQNPVAREARTTFSMFTYFNQSSADLMPASSGEVRQIDGI